MLFFICCVLLLYDRILNFEILSGNVISKIGKIIAVSFLGFYIYLFMFVFMCGLCLLWYVYASQKTTYLKELVLSSKQIWVMGFGGRCLSLMNIILMWEPAQVLDVKLVSDHCVPRCLQQLWCEIYEIVCLGCIGDKSEVLVKVAVAYITTEDAKLQIKLKVKNNFFLCK